MNSFHVDRSVNEGTVDITCRYMEVKSRFESKYHFRDVALSQVDPDEYVLDLNEYCQCRKEFINFLRCQV